jgi:hypothetical protein
MSSIRDDVKGRLRPCSMQIPRRSGRAHDIVAPLNDDAWKMLDLMDPSQQLVGLQEAIMDEIVAFDAGKGQGKVWLLEAVEQFLTDE